VGVKLAVDLDGALGDTRPLWQDWLAQASGVLDVDPSGLPADRAAAAAELDRAGAGNWRTLLARYAEDRAPVYLRRSADAADALRALHAAGAEVAVFTDAPEELARVALAHLGADRRVGSLHAGADAERRALGRLGDGATVVRTPSELTAAAAR